MHITKPLNSFGRLYASSRSCPPPPQIPPPAPAGYPAPRQYSVGEAFNYGWTKFQANIGPIAVALGAILLVSIVFAVIYFVAIAGIGSAASSDVTYDPVTGEFDGGMSGGSTLLVLLVATLFWGVYFLVSMVIQAGITRAALNITYGRPVTTKDVLSTANLASVVIASVIIAVAAIVGTILCVIPGLLVIFFTTYTIPFIVDKNAPPVEAIKMSVSFVNKNLGSLIGFFIASVLAYFVGSLLCGIGLLIAIPVILIANVYTYRVLQGETVAP